MLKRILQTLQLYTIRDARDRARYLAKKRVFGHIGENVMIQPRKVPLYAKLIRMHDNVWIASGVTFVTHDVIHQMLEGKYPDETFEEKIGCIEIMENVFVGSNVTIMYNTRIGANSIIAAGSVVTKDIPPNSIAAGVPARVIGTFSDFVEKRRTDVNAVKRSAEDSFHHRMDETTVVLMWQDFENSRKG